MRFLPSSLVIHRISKRRCFIHIDDLNISVTHMHYGPISYSTLGLSYINKPGSQSCAVAKIDKFWPVTGQSNSAERIEDCSTGKTVVVWVRKPNFESYYCGQSLVCQVWLSSGPPQFFPFSYCAWLGNWLIVLYHGHESSYKVGQTTMKHATRKNKPQ